MILPKLTAISLLLSPLLACAASGGGWNGYSVGGTLHMGKQELVSRPLQPNLPPHGRIHRIAWQITLLRPQPAGLKIKLCSQQRCLPLSSLSGRLEVHNTFLARGPFYFVYYVGTPGRLSNPMTVVKNELSITYKFE
ncbi:flagellar protein FlhE [Scandinavium sp.]|uniref:flagellar protein FlhE n=1 Tax=Scandinavium sp. TaxID=2830653 RepID=UPI00289CB622|nr:flagellar protein FlhE [Scandinavium sp.]